MSSSIIHVPLMTWVLSLPYLVLEALPFAEPALPEEDLEELGDLECDGNEHSMMWMKTTRMEKHTFFLIFFDDFVTKRNSSSLTWTWKRAYANSRSLWQVRATKSPHRIPCIQESSQWSLNPTVFHGQVPISRKKTRCRSVHPCDLSLQGLGVDASVVHGPCSFQWGSDVLRIAELYEGLSLSAETSKRSGTHQAAGRWLAKDHFCDARFRSTVYRHRDSRKMTRTQRPLCNDNQKKQANERRRKASRWPLTWSKMDWDLLAERWWKQR